MLCHLSQSDTVELETKKPRLFLGHHNRVDLRLDGLKRPWIWNYNFSCNLNLQWSRVCNDVVKWTLDCGPDYIVINSWESTFSARHLQLCQRRVFAWPSCASSVDSQLENTCQNDWIRTLNIWSADGYKGLSGIRFERHSFSPLNSSFGLSFQTKKKSNNGTPTTFYGFPVG